MTDPASTTESSQRRVAFVVQRFGPEIVGGAEALARMICCDLASNLGWKIDVYTTTAINHQTWKNELPAGTSNDGPLTVIRFPSITKRWPAFGIIDRVLRALMMIHPIRQGLERLWLIAQGPWSPKLVKALQKNAAQYDALIFMTYLYYPTAIGMRNLSGRKVLIPTAHDEAPFYFKTVNQLMCEATTILPSTNAEKHLIESVHGVKTADIAGVGIHIPNTTATETKHQLLYLGRISRGKGVHSLLEWATSPKFKETGLKLVLAGSLDNELAGLIKGPTIDYRGFVSEAEKQELLETAWAVVNPSPHESLSMIALEAMANRKPLLVNKSCPVLAQYVTDHETVFGFTDEKEFFDALNSVERMYQEPSHERALTASRDWVRKQYNWPRIREIYRAAVCDVKPS